MKDRTYRYFTGQPLYPFGYGLSYSAFRYSHIKMNALPDRQFEIIARVKNDSRRAGDEVTQLYITAPNEKPELKGFIRTHFARGQTRSVRFFSEWHGSHLRRGVSGWRPAARRRVGERRSPEELNMRREADFFGEVELDLIYVAKKLREKRLGLKLY